MIIIFAIYYFNITGILRLKEMFFLRILIRAVRYVVSEIELRISLDHDK